MGIGEALKKHPEMKKALWKDLFTGRMKTEIPLALKALGQGMIMAGAQLTVLDCSDNALGPNGMVGLVDLLKSPTCFSLQELKLNNCGLGIQGGKMLAQALSDCYAASTRMGSPLALKVFIAGRNRLENDGAKALAKIFEKLGSLEEVAMPQNGIYHPGISELSMAFSRNPNMRVLNLNDNTVRPQGAAALADAMLSMPVLKEINLGDCLLKTNGAILLAQAIAENHVDLENLNLGFNEIGPNGGLAVCDALANKSMLSTLVLDGNQFGNECREQIKSQLEENGRIDALTGLDEDDSEGEEEDETEDDPEEDYDEEEGEEEEEDYNEDDHEDDDVVEVKPNLSDKDASLILAGVESRPNTVETFIATPNPSLELFNKIEIAHSGDKLEEFRKYLKSLSDEDYLIYLSFAILKTSALSLLSPEALNISVQLYLDCTDYATRTQQMNRIRNFFLIQLGLLKSEDKLFKPSHDLNACRHAVQSAMKQDTFPTELKDSIQCFLDSFGG